MCGTSSLMKEEDTNEYCPDVTLVWEIHMVLVEERKRLQDEYSSGSTERPQYSRHRMTRLASESPQFWKDVAASTPSAVRVPYTTIHHHNVGDKHPPEPSISRSKTLKMRLPNSSRDAWNGQKENLIRDENSKPVTWTLDSLFFKKTKKAPAPRSFRLPRPLETYNGVGDPDAFLHKYQKAMKLKEANEAALSKCFEVALTGPASSWYNSLPSYSSGRSVNYATNFQPISSAVNSHPKGQSRCSM